jgi:hypothetical protein
MADEVKRIRWISEDIFVLWSENLAFHFLGRRICGKSPLFGDISIVECPRCQRTGAIPVPRIARAVSKTTIFFCFRR